MTQPCDPTKYQDMIDAILSVADLDRISIKRIRNAILELFDVDLVPHKEEVNELILNRYYKLADERAKSQLQPQGQEEEDHIMALRLHNEEEHKHETRRGRSNVSKVSKPRAKSTRVAPNNAFNADLMLSSQLQDVVGSLRMSRPQVVKQLWMYIKANDLQNASDKRKIMCDEKLTKIFKKKSVTMFEMNKLLGKHLYKEEELTANSCLSSNEVADDKDISPKNKSSTRDDSFSSSDLNLKKENQAADDASDISEVES